ncbi:hypothetical protein SERLA73DRAFT_64605 [Serpula lacrymans var. lacrymans S7.3]|uniref:Deoxycytidylate deaminase n=1 Tax=Serpula lacrymans var. lacrymans (strain S7.3) TaxID=936435 RepID=F8QEW2_SERL3|nr:hypothetical protein SERLA73DRAFT_64605 [Serpula lacrymans var. lacrymans S7.3]
MSSPITPFESVSQRFPSISFTSPASLLDHVTRNWRSNYVTVALNTQCLIEYFAKRPFFMVIYVDAPLLQRYRRAVTSNTMTLEEFVREHDQLVFRQARQEAAAEEVMNFDILRDLDSLVKISVVNAFSSISALHTHLDSLDLMNKDRLRPAWDTYFMTLADLASRRSNCMKRRVGAILVRDNRIVATGYNGTPRGLTNCNEGGCASCNKKNPSDGFSLECLCLHAEENALLEAGRERVGCNAILYCNTCPCLRCTIKIIQSDVKTVVYNLSYKVDEASAKLFREAGVELRRHIPSTKS